MGRGFTVASTAIVTAILTSAFWLFAYNIFLNPAEPDGEVTLAGDKTVIDPARTRPVTVAEGAIVGPAGLAIPVLGVKPEQLIDTYTQARAGGARRHDAIDIMAPAGTPVIAAAPGKVEKMFFSQSGGGITAYVRSSDGRWSYYYAHLHSYAPGLAEGQQVRRGQVIGRVGHTGNANPEGPHLHFAIHRMGAGESWHEGAAINPYPLLAGRRTTG